MGPTFPFISKDLDQKSAPPPQIVSVSYVASGRRHTAPHSVTPLYTHSESTTMWRGAFAGCRDGA